MPPNYRQQRGEPPAGRERRALAWVAAALVLAGLGLGSWELAGPGGSERGCVSVVVPSSTGGARLGYCGQQARAWCARSRGGTSELARLVQAACRRAGLG